MALNKASPLTEIKTYCCVDVIIQLLNGNVYSAVDTVYCTVVVTTSVERIITGKKRIKNTIHSSTAIQLSVMLLYGRHSATN